MARYKELKVLLGGDINEEAGEYINAKLGSSADQILKADIAKACHRVKHRLTEPNNLCKIDPLGSVNNSVTLRLGMC